MYGILIFVPVSKLNPVFEAYELMWPADMFYWEPVGTLISAALSQMILGSRVYAVSSAFVYMDQNVFLTYLN